jgi:hypothetical protein
LSSSRLIALLVAAALALVGCGGASDHESGEHDSGEADQGQEQALEKIPQADRIAFIGLGTAIGTLRVRAAPVAVGASPRLGPAAPLVRARSQVEELHPVDPRLARIRARLIPALTRFAGAPRAGAAARRAAMQAIAAADRIEPGLRAYSRTQPAIGGLIPD